MTDTPYPKVEVTTRAKVQVELRYREIDPVDNVGLVSAWINGEQVGSLSFGAPMRKREKRLCVDVVLGWLVVDAQWRRKGIGTAMLDYLISKLAETNRKYAAGAFTDDGWTFWEMYHYRKDTAKNET